MMLFTPAVLLLFASKLSTYITGTIRDKTKVVFFPTIASKEQIPAHNGVDNDNSNETAATGYWDVPVHGWIYEPKPRRAALAVLRKTLNITGDDHKEIFRRRMTPFLVNNHRWVAPRIRVENISPEEHHNTTFRLDRSTKNGHFQTSIRLFANESALEGKQTVDFEAILRPDDTRRFEGTAHLLSCTGVSVVSDIDDTIKISNVTNTRALLRNTFLEEFQAVPGMANVYRAWEKQHRNKNISFHFVSSSPWQLYEELETFRQREGFPQATFHLKNIRPKDRSILNLLKDPLVTKQAKIIPLFEKFPNRKFVFVGDSGERDPEVYGELARKYPQQVVGIFIRNVTTTTSSSSTTKSKTAADNNEDADCPMADRMEEAFASVKKEKWKIFNNANEILRLLDNIDVV